MKQLNDKIITWLKQHGIDKLSPDKQYLKIIEEVGELAKGLLYEKHNEIKDAIGDIYVALIGYCLQLDLDYSFELSHLYSYHTQEVLIVKLIENLSNLDFYLDDTIQLLNDIGTSVNTSYTLYKCVEHAYNEIKDRDIRIENGVAVK